MTPRLQHEPFLFENAREAAAGLVAYLTEWSGYLQYDIAVVPPTNPMRAYDGFTVQARKFDGEAVGYVAA